MLRVLFLTSLLVVGAVFADPDSDPDSTAGPAVVEGDVGDAAEEFYDYKEYDPTCDREIDACHDQHLASFYIGEDGEHISYEEYGRKVRDTPLSEQCRWRKIYHDCVDRVIEGPSCPAFVKKWFERTAFVVKFRCDDDFEDTEKHWRCLIEAHMNGDAGDCFYNATCGVHDYSNCFSIAVDSVAHSEACSAPGIVEGTKNNNRKFLQAFDEQNLLCSWDTKKTLKAMKF